MEIFLTAVAVGIVFGFIFLCQEIRFLKKDIEVLHKELAQQGLDAIDVKYQLGTIEFYYKLMKDEIDGKHKELR